MFDSAGVGPCCFAPIFALAFGLFVYALVGPKRQSEPDGSVSQPIDPGAVLLAILAGIAGCFGVAFVGGAMAKPDPWFKPFDTSIAGTYQIDPHGGYQVTFPSHEIVFREDGTFSMKHVPDLSMTLTDWNATKPGTEITATIDGSGVWRVDKDPDEYPPPWIVVAEIQRVSGANDGRVIHFSVQGNLPPYALVYVNPGGIVFRFVRK